MVEILILVVGSLLVLGTFPAVLELSLFLFANLVLRPLRRPSTPSETAGPVRKIAFLVPAHNETATIERCVVSLRSVAPGPYVPEVIVIADNCDDDTAALARAAGARVIERHDLTVRGKGAAIHHAVTLLDPEDHDAYIIIDADTVVDSEFLLVMGREFNAGKEALQCTYLVLNTDAAPKTRLMNLALLSMNVLRPLGRELLGCSVGIMGNGFGLTKKLLREVPYSANSITEDLEYHLKLIEAGRRVRFVDATRVLADFPVSKEGTETQRARWEGGRFLIQRQFFLKILGKLLTGRWSMAEPLLELCSLPLSYVVLFLAALVFLPGFTGYGLFGFGVIAAQTLVSVALHGSAQDFQALREVPGYLFWKVVHLPKILFTSRKGAAWVRTKRD